MATYGKQTPPFIRESWCSILIN